MAREQAPPSQASQITIFGGEVPAGSAGIDEAVQRLFALWVEVHHKHPTTTILNSDRRRRLEQRLREPRPDPEGFVEAAIRGCSLSDFHMARGQYSGCKRYNDIELICRPRQCEGFAEDWYRHLEAKRRREEAERDDQVYPWDR